MNIIINYFNIDDLRIYDVRFIDDFNLLTISRDYDIGRVFYFNQ